MPRTRRLTQGNYVYHVLNRGAKKGLLFKEPSDYADFEELLGEACERGPHLVWTWRYVRETRCAEISFLRRKIGRGAASENV